MEPEREAIAPVEPVGRRGVAGRRSVLPRATSRLRRVERPSEDGVGQPELDDDRRARRRSPTPATMAAVVGVAEDGCPEEPTPGGRRWPRPPDEVAWRRAEGEPVALDAGRDGEEPVATRRSPTRCPTAAAALGVRLRLGQPDSASRARPRPTSRLPADVEEADTRTSRRCPSTCSPSCRQQGRRQRGGRRVAARRQRRRRLSRSDRSRALRRPAVVRAGHTAPRRPEPRWPRPAAAAAAPRSTAPAASGSRVGPPSGATADAPSAEPWSEVPPEVQELLRAEVTRRQNASSATPASSPTPATSPGAAPRRGASRERPPHL